MEGRRAVDIEREIDSELSLSVNVCPVIKIFSLGCAAANPSENEPIQFTTLLPCGSMTLRFVSGPTRYPRVLPVSP